MSYEEDEKEREREREGDRDREKWGRELGKLKSLIIQCWMCHFYYVLFTRGKSCNLDTTQEEGN